MFEDSGSKKHTLNGLWDQSPKILGTWILWALDQIKGRPRLVQSPAKLRSGMHSEGPATSVVDVNPEALMGLPRGSSGSTKGSYVVPSWVRPVFCIVHDPKRNYCRGLPNCQFYGAMFLVCLQSIRYLKCSST